MKIKLNIDTVGFKKKPAGAEIGGVCNRVKRADRIVEIDANMLIDVITSGRTFTPAELDGTTGDAWRSQQVICIDVDNETFLKDKNGKYIYEVTAEGKRKQVRACVEEPTTPAQAERILYKHNIKPFCIYKTFSYTEAWERFRVVFILEEPITDVKQAMDYTQRLAQLIPEADPSIATPERLIFAGPKDCMLAINPRAITTLSQLEALEPYHAPQIEETAPAITKTADLVKNIDEIKAKQDRKVKRLTVEERKQLIKYDIANFNMIDFITETTAAREVVVGRTHYITPCPICGRDSNNLQIFENGGTWSSWRCYDVHNTTGITGGTIIDYLKAVYGLTTAEAMAKFEDIKGYDFQPISEHKIEELKADRAEFDREGFQEWKARKRAETTAQNAQEATEQREAEEITTEQLKGLESPNNAPQDEVTEEPAKDDLELFFEAIAGEEYRPNETGVKWLDKLFDGGIMNKTSTLIIAAPATGKTTLCQQIAEGMAENGKEVIYFSLEMSLHQMLAKTISRRLSLRNLAHIGFYDVLKAYDLPSDQRQHVREELNRYRHGSYKNIKYYDCESMKGSDVETITNLVTKAGEEAKAKGKNGPAVFLDYLHLVNGANQDQAENIKQTLKALKSYAIKYNTFVIAISAINRDSMKKGQITLNSGRDTSAIEYSGDYQLSLNYLDYELGNKDPQKPEDAAQVESETPRKLVLRLLKNRGGAGGKSEGLLFYPKENVFFSYDDEVPAHFEPATKLFYKQPQKRR